MHRPKYFLFIVKLYRIANIMIKYALDCENKHKFESWVQSAEAFDKLVRSGLLCCSVCGVNKVSKAIMTPNIGIKNNSKSNLPKTNNELPLSTPSTKTEKAIKQFRKHIEKNSENVGPNFASEARKMHIGDVPERSIYGESTIKEAKELIDDEISVVPLPFIPSKKTN